MTSRQQPSLVSRRAVLALSVGVSVGALGGLATACADTDDPVTPLPADRIVFGVSSGGGLVPMIFWVLQSPTLIIYGSGRVLVRSDNDRSFRGVPAEYTEAQIDPLTVAAFVADAERRGVLNGDFGSPQVTDLGSTRVWLHGSGDRQDAAAYALSERFDEYVSFFQARRRGRLRNLIGRGQALIGDAGHPYVPERVVVLEQRVSDGDERATVVWPGPDPASFLHPPTTSSRGAMACGELTGEQAATVYRAARDNEGQRWLVNGTSRVLAVNSLPVEIDC